MADRPGCAQTRDLLAEIAAGVASGEERIRASRHLRGCRDCRRELDDLSEVVDELLTLIPPVEPPAGLERAVLARLADGALQAPGPARAEASASATAPPRRRWWQRPALRLATLGALAMAVGAGVTLQVTAGERRVAHRYQEVLRVAQGRYLTVRVLTAPDGADAGRVFAYEGRTPWLFVVVRDYPAAVGTYQVHLVTRDGRDRIIGEVTVAGGGQGSWGAAIDGSVAEVAEVRLTGPAGPPLTAVFR